MKNEGRENVKRFKFAKLKRALAVLMSVALVLGGTLTNFGGANILYVNAEEENTVDSSDPRDGVVNDEYGVNTFTFKGKKDVGYEYKLFNPDIATEDGWEDLPDTTKISENGDEVTYTIEYGNCIMNEGCFLIRRKGGTEILSNNTDIRMTLDGTIELSTTEPKVGDTIWAKYKPKLDENALDVDSCITDEDFYHFENEKNNGKSSFSFTYIIGNKKVGGGPGLCSGYTVTADDVGKTISVKFKKSNDPDFDFINNMYDDTEVSCTTSVVTDANDFPADKDPKNGEVYDGDSDRTFTFTGKKDTVYEWRIGNETFDDREWTEVEPMKMVEDGDYVILTFSVGVMYYIDSNELKVRGKAYTESDKYYKAGEILTNDEPFRKPLFGTASLSNMNPKVGDTIEATFDFGNGKTHTISGFEGYIFCAFVDENGNVLQAPSSNGTYTVKTGDVGKTIRAKLSKGNKELYNDAIVWSGFTSAVKAADSSSSGSADTSGDTNSSSSSGDSSGGSSGSSSGSTGSTGGSTGSTGGSTGSTNTETKPDGTKVETSTETKPDGTKVETSTETKPDGTKVETSTETKPDGSKVEKVTTTETDGSSTAVEKETKTNTSGNNVEVTATVKTDADGNITSKTEKSVIENIAENTSAVVTVKTDSEGETTAAAKVTNTGNATKTGMKTEISADVVKQVTEAAGTTDVVITQKVTDEDGKTKYTIKINAEDLTVGESLTIVRVKKNGKKVLVDAKNYKVTEDGVNVTLGGANATYELVNSDDAKTISDSIIKSVKVGKSSKSVKAGNKTAINIKADNKADNVKKITYITSDKSVASVDKNGNIITKQKGTVTIKAKVTLKNGKSKTVSMKVNVK